MEIEKALKELRNSEKRKFIQTLDLIVNLKDFDARRQPINTFIALPNPAEKKICAFLSKKSGESAFILFLSLFGRYRQTTMRPARKT